MLAASSKENQQDPTAKILSWCGASREPTAEETAAEAQRVVLEQAVDVTVDGDGWLEAWEAYPSWAEQNPAGAADVGGLKGLLIRCVTELTRSRRYRNDLQSLVLTITHIDTCRNVDAIEVFESMYAQGLGLKFALLYEGWAVVLERAKNYEAAEKIYELRIRNAERRRAGFVEGGFVASYHNMVISWVI